MSEAGAYTVEEGGIGVIMINNSPVNALGIQARQSLDEGLRRSAE